MFVTAVVYQAGLFENKSVLNSSHHSDTLAVNSLLRRADYYFEKPNRTLKYLDSSLSVLTDAFRISKEIVYQKGKGTCLDRYSKIYNARGDTLNGRKYADSAIAVFKDNHLYYDLGFAYFNRSGFYPLDGKPLKLRIEYVKLAVAAFARSGSTLKQADILKELGDLQQYDLNMTEAIPNLQQSLALYASISKYKESVDVHSLLVNVYGTIGNYPLALKHGLIALKIFEEVNDTLSTSVATTYNRLGINYQRIKRYSLAVKCFSAAQRISMKNNDSVSWAIITYNLARSYYAMGKTGKGMQMVLDIPENASIRNLSLNGNIHAFLMMGYLKLKEYGKCRAYCNLLLKDYTDAKQMDVPLMTVTNALAKYYIASNEYTKVEFYLKENDVIFKRNRQLANRITSYDMWRQLDSVRGDFYAYVKHARAAEALSDSALSERNNQEITQLQMEYESEKRDRAIFLKEERIKLLNAENQLQESSLKQTMLVRNITIGGGVLLTIIILLLYSSYRLKNKSNLKVNAQNASLNRLVTEKEWLLKEIHHRVKNNLQIIISLLDSQSMYLRDTAAINAIRDSQSRVYCMSLIHKKLYQSDNVYSIHMNSYVKELVDYLSSTFGVQDSICFELNVTALQFTAAQSIPIGLILNEAITNSIKYAFPEKSKNSLIKVNLHTEGNQCRIMISDNGIGLPLRFTGDRDQSLGINLMKGLSEDIDAVFSIRSEKGTHVEIVFSVVLANSLPTKQNHSLAPVS